MKYYFIVNPNSGKRKKQQRFMEGLKAAAKKLGIEYQVYCTTGVGDGARYTEEVCRQSTGAEGKGSEKLRIYACGGDGTINEVVNGAFGFSHVEVGAVPLGTGNDFIRNYGTASDFLDMERQLTGRSVSCDLIGYRAEHQDMVTEGYCANMFNIGFDCNVVDMTARVKNWPLVGGTLAYMISVAIILIEKKGADLRVIYEDGSEAGGKILLIAIANGCYCGGGVKGVPYSMLDDGLMDVSVVNDMSRRFFMALFPSYSKGVHMEKKQIRDNDVIRYTKEKTLTVIANGESLRLCTDGEITTQRKVEFWMEPKAFRFIVPGNR